MSAEIFICRPAGAAGAGLMELQFSERWDIRMLRLEHLAAGSGSLRPIARFSCAFFGCRKLMGWSRLSVRKTARLLAGVQTPARPSSEQRPAGRLSSGSTAMFTFALFGQLRPCTSFQGVAR